MSHFAEAIQSDFKALAREFPGADTPWLQDIRKQAFNRFKTEGLPTVEHEEWKYTDLQALQESAFRTAASKSGDGAGAELLDAVAVPQISDHRIVFVNGNFNGDLSSIGALPRGVAFKDLNAVLKHDCGRLEDHFRTHTAQDTPVLVSLNSAFVSDGALIEVEDGVELQEPLHVVFVSEASTAPLMAAPRIIIKAGANSRFAVVESYQGRAPSNTLTNALTEIVAGPGSSVEHYRIQREGPGAFHLANVFIAGRRDSTVTSHSIALGGALTRVDIRAALTEPGSSVNLNGLFFAADRQHVDHHTRIDHFAPDTHSTENYKGILDDSARGVFNGKVIVHPDAQRISATQSNKNLLLSSGAEMDTKPELEIYADDVKCAHGATVGQLDHNALFYLRSRGVSEADARALLTFAFTQDVVANMAQPGICEWLRKFITRKTGQAQLLQESA
jgi:Fe-S cluster assembly protein SufD